MYCGLDKGVLEALDAGLDGAIAIGGAAATADAFLGTARSHGAGETDAARAGYDKIIAW